MPSQGFPREGFGCRRGRQKSMITLEAMSVAELPTADPLTRGRAVACQLLTKQRRLPDDVDGGGLRCRRCSLRLRRSNASCTGLGSSDEANSGEQGNNDTHRYTLHRATAPSGTRAAFLAAGDRVVSCEGLASR